MHLKPYKSLGNSLSQERKGGGREARIELEEEKLQCIPLKKIAAATGRKRDIAAASKQASNRETAALLSSAVNNNDSNYDK
jgi:hypothetical protein